MKSFFVVLFVLHSALATQPNTPTHVPAHFTPQHFPQHFAPQTFAPHQVSGHHPEAVRRGRYLADSVTVDPVYKTVWSPSWSPAWSVPDSGLFYGAHVAPVQSWKYEAVPSWKKVESVPAWKVASYDSSWKVQPVSSWKIAPKEDAWKVEKWAADKWAGDKWVGDKWVADEKLWNSAWSGPSAVVSGPSFYAGAPYAWSAPVIKKQWGYAEPKPVSYYGPQAVEHVGAYSAGLKWVKPVESVYEESARPFQYSSTIVHEKPVVV